MRKIVLLIICMQIAAFAMSQNLTYDIRLNQIGFLPNSIKLAAVVNAKVDSFKVMTSDLQTTVYRGQMLPAVYYPSSGEEVRIADFTLMTQTGTFVIVVNGLGKSVPFRVSDKVYTDLLKGTLKYYYYNRASMDITPRIWRSICPTGRTSRYQCNCASIGCHSKASGWHKNFYSRWMVRCWRLQ